MVHILAWGVFLYLLITLVPRPKHMHPILFILIPNIFFILFYYLNFFLLVPKYFIQKKYVLYGFICLMCLVIILAVPSIIAEFSVRPQIPPFGPDRPPHFNRPDFPGPGGFRFIRPEFGYTIFVFAFIMFLSLGIRITLQLQQTEKEKVNAELSFLKAQINPHFLFNSLNNIYSMAVNKSKNTAEAIEMFSEIMRFVIFETQHDFVPMERKIEYINNYIALQKLRLSSTVEVNYTVTGVPGALQIAPMLLMPFIENAFKHGISTEKKSVIDIRLEISDNELHMLVKNTKFSKIIPITNNPGLGIKNTVKRLELIYPGKYMLNISDNEKEYCVSLHITLK